MAVARELSARRQPRGSAAGSAMAAVMGSLATVLCVALWALLATLLGGLEVGVPLTWAVLGGAGLGLALSLLPRRGAAGTASVLGTAAALAALWLALSGGAPLPGGGRHLFWTEAGALLALLASAQLTRYGLRDLALHRPDRDTVETVALRALRALGFTFFLAVVVFPFYFMVASSLKPRAMILQDPTFLGIDLSRGLADLLEGYREVLVTFDFLRFIGNSALVAIATMVITLVLGVLGAYAVTRLRFRGREAISRAILLIYMFPAIVLVIPLYAVFSGLGWRDTLPGLLVVYPATTLPVALYMLRSYFLTLPRDLEEAGLIDGCSRVGVIWRITLPLALPALASVALYVFMIAWNEFLFAFMFLDSPENFTLSRGMVGLNSQEVPRQFLMAGAVIVTVPIMVLFFFFEKYLVSGLTAGGVKG